MMVLPSCFEMAQSGLVGNLHDASRRKTPGPCSESDTPTRFAAALASLAPSARRPKEDFGHDPMVTQ
jgi:hypothetical protein